MGVTSDIWLGVDVGTRSVRAGLFDPAGRLVASASHPITLFQDGPDLAEYESADIWAACGSAIRAALERGGVAADWVKGIGFDATCSLVASGPNGEPVSVSPRGAAGRDTICWMDHRAIAEADDINATRHPVLERVGSAISPEMQLPKLLWLKRHRPDAFAAAGRFHDLPDWLAHKATGEDARSLCSIVCKWTYFGERGLAGEGWDAAFFERIGLAELVAGNARAIGNRAAEPGARIGSLTTGAAAELGLVPGIPVAAGSIDAHAGAIGTLAAGGVGRARMAVIAGTSICHIALTDGPVPVPGVWGPYYGIVLPGIWALEGGQSAGGALIDRLVDAHPATAPLRAAAERGGVSVFAVLEAQLAALSGGGDVRSALAADLHVQPDFLGNRSPLADAERRGAIVGLTMDVGVDDLARLYLACLQSLAYGTRHIIEAMADSGNAVHELVVSGGLARNRLFLRELADATGCAVVVPGSEEPVLLGGAMLAATASGAHRSLEDAMGAMAGPAERIAPDPDARAFHDRKYRVYRRMQDDFAVYRQIMDEGE
ncbi:MAG: FGGY-family carbohydrate kinase [Bauldia sp.]|nr:FGGY-family carbohydrate kinase [Bauldia sp.]